MRPVAAKACSSWKMVAPMGGPARKPGPGVPTGALRRSSQYGRKEPWATAAGAVSQGNQKEWMGAKKESQKWYRYCVKDMLPCVPCPPPWRRVPLLPIYSLGVTDCC